MGAHEVQEEGYRFHFQEATGGGSDMARAKQSGIMPPVITVFSAPNYCGRYGNKAAFIRLTDPSTPFRASQVINPLVLMQPVQYNAVWHPEPVLVENAQRRQNARIETTCPYMPTT